MKEKKDQLTSINQRQFVHLMLVAASALSNQSKYLNDINVFPVADGDTGFNMSATLNALHSDISLFEDYTFEELADKIMRSVMLHSQGNSGTVLSQFFKGFLKSISTSESLDCSELKKAFEKAHGEAWRSFEKPERGTVLDIVDSLQLTVLPINGDIKLYFQQLADDAAIALEKTQRIHPVMKRSHVVDSGAAGLTIIIKAWNELIQSDFEEIPLDVIATNELKTLPDHIDFNDEFQFCTELVIKFPSEEPSNVIPTIKSDLSKLGDYVQVVTYRDLIKVHIHTNTPETVKQYLQKIGEEISYKSDDMLLMQKGRMSKTDSSLFSTAQSTQPHIIIVTDSSADYVDKPKNVSIVQLPVFDENNKQVGDLDSQAFYNKMVLQSNFKPKTSKPSEGSYLETFQKINTQNPKVRIICCTISSGLSATYNGAKIAAEMFSKESNSSVLVIDSLSASGGLAWFTEELSKRITPSMSDDDIMSLADTLKKSITTYFVVDNMKYLYRNGRISKPLSIIGKMLNMSPILKLDEGKIKSSGSPLLFANTIKQIKKLKTILKMESSMIFPSAIHIVYAGDEVLSYAQELADYGAELGIARGSIRLTLLNKVIGAHTGPRSLGLFIFNPESPNAS